MTFDYSLDTTIKELLEWGRISVRTHNALNAAGYDTLGGVLDNITSDYNARLLAADIKAYFEVNRNAVEVLLFKGKKTISVNRYVTQSPLFYRQFFDERSDKSITAKNTSNKKAAPYMMQPFIQTEQYL